MTQESPNNNIRALHARIYPSIEEFNKPNLQVGFSDEDASFFSGQFQAFPTFFGSGEAKSSFHYAATSNWLQSFLTLSLYMNLVMNILSTWRIL
nr:uncharacterized protein LOC103429348 isoform X2 [Malus domestica]